MSNDKYMNKATIDCKYEISTIIKKTCYILNEVAFLLII